MGEVVYRGYAPADLKAMVALDDVCFDARFRFSLRAMRRFAEASNAFVCLAEIDGAIAGFVIAHVERQGVYLVTLDVAPEVRRRGIAAGLMERVEGFAGRARLVLLHVFVGNAAAVAFYERHGYELVGRAAGFYGAGLDALVYRRAV